jgi:hypothetical protein
MMLHILLISFVYFVYFADNCFSRINDLGFSFVSPCLRGEGFSILLLHPFFCTEVETLEVGQAHQQE